MCGFAGAEALTASPAIAEAERLPDRERLSPRDTPSFYRRPYGVVTPVRCGDIVEPRSQRGVRSRPRRRRARGPTARWHARLQALGASGRVAGRAAARPGPSYAVTNVHDGDPEDGHLRPVEHVESVVELFPRGAGRADAQNHAGTERRDGEGIGERHDRGGVEHDGLVLLLPGLEAPLEPLVQQVHREAFGGEAGNEG